jgi:hypothetical protein
MVYLLLADNGRLVGGAATKKSIWGRVLRSSFTLKTTDTG